jgi:hypothetical protein
VKRDINSTSYRSQTLPNVIWRDRANVVLEISGQELALRDVKAMLRDGEAKAREMLESDLLLGLELPWTNSDGKLRDELSNARPGYSFLSDPQNPFESNKWAVMSCLATAHASLYVKSVQAQSIVWDVNTVSEYVNKCVIFFDLLGPLIHISYGGPARRTELLTAITRNSRTSVRHLYMMLDRVAIVTRYHKGANQYGSDKTIPRYLPVSLGRLLILYLAYVRPVEEAFLKVLGTESTECFLYMRQGEVWDARHLTLTLRLLSEPYVGFPLTVKLWRQIHAAYIKLWSLSILAEEDVEIEDVDHVQAGHSTRTAESAYGMDAGAIRSLGESGISAFFQASVKWQRHLGYVDAGADGECCLD